MLFEFIGVGGRGVRYDYNSKYDITKNEKTRKGNRRQ
jgi:hypothetical protein